MWRKIVTKNVPCGEKMTNMMYDQESRPLNFEASLLAWSTISRFWLKTQSRWQWTQLSITGSCSNLTRYIAGSFTDSCSYFSNNFSTGSGLGKWLKTFSRVSNPIMSVGNVEDAHHSTKWAAQCNQPPHSSRSWSAVAHKKKFGPVFTLRGAPTLQYN